MQYVGIFKSLLGEEVLYSVYAGLPVGLRFNPLSGASITSLQFLTVYLVTYCTVYGSRSASGETVFAL